MRPRTRRALALVGLALGVATALPVLAHVGNDPRPGATKWDLETKVTDAGGLQGGLDPSVVTDSFGTVFASAAVPTVAAPHTAGALPARVSPWLWSSTTHGKTWTDVPLDSTGAAQRLPALGSEVAVTGDDTLLAVQTFSATIRVSRWKTGAGATLRPLGTVPIVSGMALGTQARVATFGTTGVVVIYDGPLGWQLQRSLDSGAHFLSPQLLGQIDSCTVAGQSNKRIKTETSTLALACLAGGRWVTSTSTDAGATWRTTTLSQVGGQDEPETPQAVVASNGTPYALTIDSVLGGSRLHLWTPKKPKKPTALEVAGIIDWESRDITDGTGRFSHARLTAAANGLLGIIVHRQDTDGSWFVLGAAFETTGPVYLINFAGHTPVARGTATPPGTRVGASFDRENRLAIVWTVQSNQLGLPEQLDSTVPQDDVWFVRSRVPTPHAAAPVLERSTTSALPVCTIAGQVTRHDTWDLIRGPVWRTRTGGAGQSTVDYVVDPFHPATVTITNGTSIARSEDAGCTWREIWSLEPAADGAGRTSANTRIVSVDTTRSRGASGSLWVVLENGNRTGIMRSLNGEPGSFKDSSDGLPIAGRPLQLVLPANNPNIGYLSIARAGLFGGLYAFGDDTNEAVDETSGSWTQRGSALAGAPTITAMAADPLGSNGLWAVLNGYLKHSTDGGRTWDGKTLSTRMQDQAPADISAIDVWHAAGESAKVLAYAGPANAVTARVFSSADNGATWDFDDQPGIGAPVESIARGSNPDIVVIGTVPDGDEGASIYHLHLEDGDYDPFGPEGLVLSLDPHVSSDARAHPTFYAVLPTGLIRYAGDEVEPGPPADPVVGPSFLDSTLLAPIHLLSDGAVSLDVGDSRTIPVSVSLPPQRPKVDVFLLTDTTESMATHLPIATAAFAQGLKRLTAAGYDVWGGVGEYKTDRSNPKYRRARDVGPLDSGLSAALNELRAASSGYGLETQLIALRQVITGDGLQQCTALGCLDAAIGSLCEADPNAVGCSILPGQNVRFRKGSIAIVLHVADTSFRNPDGTPRNASGRPDLDGVAAMYQRAGVLNIGVVVPGGREIDDSITRIDLGKMARTSGALAGPLGIDCDADGRADVAQGHPAVCALGSGKGIASMLEDVALGQLGPATLTMSARDAGKKASVLTSFSLQLADGAQRTAQLQISCPHAGSREIELTADATVIHGLAPLPVSRTITVSCLTPASEGKPIVAPVVGAAAAPALGAQPPAQPATQTQLQQQAQPSFTSAVNEEQQEEAELALVLLGIAAAAGTALALRRSRSSDGSESIAPRWDD